MAYQYIAMPIGVHRGATLTEIRIISHGAEMDFKNVESKIQGVIKKFVKQEGNSNARFSVNFLTDQGWLNSTWFDYGDTVPEGLFDSNIDYDFSDNKYQQVSLIIQELPTKAGGKDEFNDCLFKCCKFAFGGTYEMPKYASTPEDFKKMLNLNRTDKVPVDMLPVVECKLRICIRCSGEHTYVGRMHRDFSKQRILNIVYKNHHFSIQKEFNNTLNCVNGVRFKETKDVKFYVVSGVYADIYEVEKEPRRITVNELFQEKIDNKNSLYVSIDSIYKKKYDESNIKDIMNEWYRNADLLKKYSYKEFVNLYKCENYAKCALQLFKNTNGGTVLNS